MLSKENKFASERVYESNINKIKSYKTFITYLTKLPKASISSEIFWNLIWWIEIQVAHNTNMHHW